MVRPSAIGAAAAALLAASSPSATASAAAAAAYCPPFVAARPFATSAVSAPARAAPQHRRDSMTMKVSSGKKRVGRKKDNSLMAETGRRTRTAGRVGTKRYVDPSKVFVGNLPYDADEDDVLDFFGDHLGDGVVRYNVQSVKVVRDWRSGRSKGYGFVTFLEPVMATQAMDVMRGKEMRGRVVNLTQGQRRVDPSTVWRKKKRPQDDVAGRDEEDGSTTVDDEAEESDAATGLDDIISLEDFDDADDLSLFADDEDGSADEEFEFDGVFEDIYKKELADEEEDDDEEMKQMNREQRREASKGKKKRKLPHTGFG